MRGGGTQGERGALGVQGGNVKGAVAQPRHTEQSCYVRLEELGDGADDLEDVQDARLGVLLRVEVTVYGNEEEVVGVAGTPDDLYGADGVKDNGVYFAILYIFEGAFMQGYDVAMIDFRFH